MTKRCILLISIQLIISPAFSQDIERQEADSMIIALTKIKGGINRVDLLLNLAKYYILKPGELKADFDSAKVYIDEASILNRSLQSSTTYGYQVLIESYMTKEKGQVAEGKKMVEKAITILKSGDNKSYLGSAYFELSLYYDYNDSLQLMKKIALVEQSINAFQQTRDFKRRGSSLEMLGDLYNITQEFGKSIQVLNQALASYDSINYQKIQGVYVLLGSSYRDQGKYGQALSHFLKALKIAQITNDTLMRLCQIDNQLGLLYFSIGRDETSVKYYNDALKIAKKCNDDYAILILATNLSNSYNRLKQSDEALKILHEIPKKYDTSRYTEVRYVIGLGFLTSYLGLKQLSNAQPYCDSLLQMADNNLVNPRYKTNIYRTVSKFYFDKKDFVKSRRILAKSIDIGKTIDYANGRLLDLQLLYKLDSAQQNIGSAFNDLLAYKTEMDFATSERNMRQFEVLNVEYERGMKDDSIISKNKDIALLTQENRLKQTKLEQESLVKNVTIAGIGLALVIIGLLYWQYRHKQKSNQVITQKNELLQHLVTEKEWLLKEIHHRVKNNLQVVMSLLNSQSEYIDNESALTAIHDSQRRVHAISLIHQRLYGSETVSSIDISFYIRELVSYLSDSFNIGQRIRFELSVEPLELDVSQAVPLGLILNEAITNSIKYAFPNGRSGLIAISLTNISHRHYMLVISDNGIGIPVHFKDKRPGSLGMSLMKGLSEDLDGTFSIENESGTTIRVSFVHDLSIKQHRQYIQSFVLNN